VLGVWLSVVTLAVEVCPLTMKKANKVAVHKDFVFIKAPVEKVFSDLRSHRHTQKIQSD
jgi:hypothetical protein